MSNSKNMMYAINEKSFQEHFIDYYRKNFEPRSLIQFPVLLPFHVPVDNGTCFSVLDEGFARTYHFTTININEPVSAGILTEEPFTLTTSQSRVEMVYISADMIPHLTEEELSDVFDALIDGLNLFMIAYIVHTKDDDVCRVTKEMLEFSTVYQFVPLDSWEDAERSIFFLNWNVPHQKENIPKEQKDLVVWYANILNKNWNPFIFAEEFILRARRAIKRGLLSEAAIFSQVYVETFLGILITNLMLIEGKASTEIEQELEDMSFMSMVKSQFHTRIGGKWNPDAAVTEIGRWYEKTYLLRNRIVHSGHFPSFAEAAEAIDASSKFVAYVVLLIKVKKKDYPGITRFFEPPPRE